MPQPLRPDPTKSLIEVRRCPKCGVAMFLACIQPTDKTGYDERSFECTQCDYAETEIVQFG
jgi:ribosomal protein S27AE